MICARPYKALSLANEMLARSLPDESKTEIFKTCLATLRRNISRLEALIKSVLQEEANLQLTEVPKIERREFDLWALVKPS